MCTSKDKRHFSCVTFIPYTSSSHPPRAGNAQEKKSSLNSLRKLISEELINWQKLMIRNKMATLCKLLWSPCLIIFFLWRYFFWTAMNRGIFSELLYRTKKDGEQTYAQVRLKVTVFARSSKLSSGESVRNLSGWPQRNSRYCKQPKQSLITRRMESSLFIYYFTASEFFTPTLSDGFSPKFEW